MARYYPERERIFLTGLSGLSAAERSKVGRRRKNVCASSKAEYAWMRIDPCAKLPHTAASDVLVLSSSRAMSKFLHEAVDFAGRGVEYMMIACLNNRLQPMAVAVPHKGGRASSIVDPTVVFQAVILSGASAFVIAHNHPTGIPDPSQEDVDLTARMMSASRYLGLQLLDHIVLTDDPDVYTSFLDSGLLQSLPFKGLGSVEEEAEVPAETWREELIEDADDASRYAITQTQIAKLTPVLEDLGEPEVYDALKEYFRHRDVELFFEEEPVAAYAMKQLEEQILNASDQQILAYQVAYIRGL